MSISGEFPVDVESFVYPSRCIGTVACCEQVVRKSYRWRSHKGSEMNRESIGMIPVAVLLKLRDKVLLVGKW